MSAAPTDKLLLRANRRSLLLAAIGAAVGITLGFLSVMQWLELGTLPNSVVARVNQVDILRGQYETALSLLASEKRGVLTDADRTLVLERMIEEELLAQHGFSIGLVRSDRSLRMAMIESLIKGVTVEFEASAKNSGENDKTVASVEGRESQVDVIAESPQQTALDAYIEQLQQEANIEWIN